MKRLEEEEKRAADTFMTILREVNQKYIGGPDKSDDQHQR